MEQLIRDIATQRGVPVSEVRKAANKIQQGLQARHKGVKPAALLKKAAGVLIKLYDYAVQTEDMMPTYFPDVCDRVSANGPGMLWANLGESIQKIQSLIEDIDDLDMEDGGGDSDSFEEATIEPEPPYVTTNKAFKSLQHGSMRETELEEDGNNDNNPSSDPMNYADNDGMGVSRGFVGYMPSRNP